MNNNIISLPKLLPRELNQGGTGTTETTFSSDGTLPVILPLPTGGQMCGLVGAQKASVAFKVIATGRVTTGTTSNVTVKMYFGTSLTPGSNTAIASTGAVSVVSASCPWRIDATLVIDATSNKIDGWYETVLNGTRVAPTVITAAVTSADPDAGGTLGFTVTGTFGTGNAGNIMNLDWFALILGN